MNRYIVSAIALMASTGVALAQSPKGPDAAPPAGKQEASPPSESSGKSMSPSPEKSQGATTNGDSSRRSETKGSPEGKSNTNSAQPGKEPANTGQPSRAEKEPSNKEQKSTGAAEKGDSGKSARTKEQSKGAASADVKLQPEQQTKVVTSFKKHHVAPATNVNIGVSVGTIVPKRIKLYAIPQDILVIAPAYKKYRYFVVDDKVIIVEPVTYEIVDVLIIA